jgi:adenylyltransferase/sulfurtransferase
MDGDIPAVRLRYSRQILFKGIGEAGQQKLLGAKAVVIGCGALGSVIANNLARAGVGRLVLIDRDVIELHNLHRQVIYDEEDVARQMPKAAAAARKLQRVNSSIRIQPVVIDVQRTNIEDLIRGADVVLDGTDNFSVRYLINDACLKLHIPWIYGGVVESHGMSMTIQPHSGPCLRCLFAEMPPPDAAATADTAGVIGPIVNVIGSIESAEAMKLLTGSGTLNQGLITVDLWTNAFARIDVPERTDGCPACGKGDYEFLEGRGETRKTAYSVRNAVHIAAGTSGGIDLANLAARLAPAGEVSANEFLLRLTAEGCEMTLFADGRAIIRGTSDEAFARDFYDRYAGA